MYRFRRPRAARPPPSAAPRRAAACPPRASPAAAWPAVVEPQHDAARLGRDRVHHAARDALEDADEGELRRRGQAALAVQPRHALPHVLRRQPVEAAWRGGTCAPGGRGAWTRRPRPGRARAGGDSIGAVTSGMASMRGGVEAARRGCARRTASGQPAPGSRRPAVRAPTPRTSTGASSSASERRSRAPARPRTPATATGGGSTVAQAAVGRRELELAQSSGHRARGGGGACGRAARLRRRRRRPGR